MLGRVRSLLEWEMFGRGGRPSAKKQEVDVDGLLQLAAVVMVV